MKINFNQLFLLLILLLFFLTYFKPDPIPMNVDDFWVISSSEAFIEGFSDQKKMNSFIGDGLVVGRPLSNIYSFMVYGITGNNISLLVIVSSLFSSILAVILILVNYFLFKKIFGETTALLASFLLGSTHALIYSTQLIASASTLFATIFLLLAIYFAVGIEKKNYLYLFCLFSVLAIFSREVLMATLLPISILLFASNKKVRSKFSRAFLLFLPSILFIFYLTAVIFFLIPLTAAYNSKFVQFVGFLQLPQNFPELISKVMHILFVTEGNFYIIPIAIVAGIIFISSCNLKKIKFNASKLIKQSFLKKHFIALLLLIWIISGFLVEVNLKLTPARHFLLFLPAIFGIVSFVLSKNLIERNEKLRQYFMVFLLLNLLFLIAFLNFDSIKTTFSSWDTNAILNFFFFSLMIAGFLLPLIAFVKYRALYLIGIVLLCPIISINIVGQGAEANNFYGVHYNHSAVALQGNLFLAEELPKNSNLFIEQDIPWIKRDFLIAFERTDIELKEFSSAGLKKNDFLLFNNRVSEKMGKVVKENPKAFNLIASFGNEEKKYSRVMIKKERIIEGRLFEFYRDKGVYVNVYKFIE